tara:strand:- start:5482 stop:6261 length:780 start_codon:yes stop_codon:yes gene_type:complete
MIKFFRKIRQNLLSEGKTGKYIKYAIGEIVLVVVGILIALQINNWNEQRKYNKTEEQILIGLEEEFKASLAELKRITELNKKVRKATFDLIQNLRSKDPFEDANKIDSLILKIYMFYTFTAESGILDEAISSGKLSYIRNEKLQGKLASWKGKLANSEEDYAFRAKHYNELLLPFLQKNLRMANGDNFMELNGSVENYQILKLDSSPFTPNYENINLIEFENLLWQHKTDNEFIIMLEIELLEFTEGITKMIQSELNLK